MHLLDRSCVSGGYFFLKLHAMLPNRKKRIRSDMDDLARYTGMKQFGSGHFMEAPDTNNCGECNETVDNIRRCMKRPRTNTSTSQTCAGRGGSAGTRGGRTSLRGGHGGRTSLGGGHGYGGSRTRRVDRGRPIDVLLNPDC